MTTRNQQVARIDYEDDREIDGAVEAAVIDRIDALAASARCHPDLRLPEGRRVARGGRRRPSPRRGAGGVPLLVDPKVPHIDYYAGATVITPNHHEAEAVTLMRIRDERRRARRPRSRFRERARCESVLITRGEHGMWLLGPRRRSASCRPRRAKSPDVTGAGDTVIATMALALAAGATLATPPASPTAPPASSSASSGPRRSRPTSCGESIQRLRLARSKKPVFQHGDHGVSRTTSVAVSNPGQVTDSRGFTRIDTDRARSACRAPNTSDKPAEVSPKRAVSPARANGVTLHALERRPGNAAAGVAGQVRLRMQAALSLPGCLHPRSRLTCPRSARLERLGTCRTRASVNSVNSVLKRRAAVVGIQAVVIHTDS